MDVNVNTKVEMGR